MLGFIDDTTRCWSPGEDALDEGRSGDAYAPPPIAPLLTLTTMPTPACAHAASSLARDASRVCPDAAALLPLRSHSPAGRGRLLVSRTLAWASCRAQGARRFGDRQVRRADKSPHSRAQPRTARTAAHSRAQPRTAAHRDSRAGSAYRPLAASLVGTSRELQQLNPDQAPRFIPAVRVRAAAPGSAGPGAVWLVWSVKFTDVRTHTQRCPVSCSSNKHRYNRASGVISMPWMSRYPL